jgi:Domain of unknown function (DUF4157)
MHELRSPATGGRPPRVKFPAGRRAPIDALRSRVSPSQPALHGLIQNGSSCTCGGGCPRCASAASSSAVVPIQRQPTISAPRDADEREADEVADQVMRFAEPALISPAAAAVQRQCAPCELEEQTTIRTMRTSSPNTDATLDTGAAVRAAGRGGAPLSNHLRAYFEPRFGHDFSGVRVHADGEAASAARGVQARAYTFGNDIVFGSGEYAPATQHGRRLLAHELVHVVQQGKGPLSLSRQPITPCDPSGCAAGPVPGSSSEFHDTPGTGVQDTRQRNAAAITGPTTSPAPNLTNFVKQELLPRDVTLYTGLMAKANIVVDLAHAAQTGAVSFPGSPGTINIPKSMEDEAADYMTKGPGFKANSIGGWSVADWKRATMMTFAHEFEHHRDWPGTPDIKAGRTNSAADTDAFKKELGDMDANLAMYSVQYDESVKQDGFNPGRVKTQAWIKNTLANGPGESLTGMITKLRCISPCDDVEKMVMRVFRWKLADSSLEKQRFLLMVLKTDPYVPLSKLAGQLLDQVDKGAPIP